jgi:hypothetical protein
VSVTFTAGATDSGTSNYVPLTVSKSAGDHTFTVTFTPSAACGKVSWNIDGNPVGESSGCGGSSITVNLNQPGLTIGTQHFIGASYEGNENYASAFGIGGFELVA